MNLNEIKTRRTLEFLQARNASNQSGGSLNEGKERKFSRFIKDCVTAIVKKPETMRRIRRKKDGSPFGICQAAQDRNPSLAPKHAATPSHSEREWKGALAKLRQETEELRISRPSRRQIVFESEMSAPQGEGRRRVVYHPQESE